MADSDDEDILYDNDFGRNLIGGKRIKNLDDVMNSGKKDKRKLRKTLALCLAFLSLGLCLAILGPTLLSLQKHLNTTLPKISWVFAGRSVGYLSGAILGGMLFESFNPIFLLTSVLFVCGVGITVAPFVASVLVLAVCISSVGIGMGVLDTGANLVCLRMWGRKRSATMLQALHFSFALGAFIAPLVAAPFLAQTSPNGDIIPPTPAHLNVSIPTSKSSAESLADVNSTTETLNISTSAMPSSQTPLNSSLASSDTPSPPSTSSTSAKPTSTASHSTSHSTTIGTTTPSLGASTSHGSSIVYTTEITTIVTSTADNGSSSATSTKVPPTHSTPKTPSPKREKREPDTDEPVEVGGKDSEGGDTDVTDGDEDATGETEDTSKSGQSSPKHQVERFAIAYLIIGAMVLLTSLIFLYFLCTRPKDEPQYIGSEVQDQQHPSKKFPFRTRIITLLFFFYFLYVGGEVAYGSFVSMFAVKSEHGFAEDRASHVAALFWGSFSLGRGLAICLASIISPLKMVVGDMVGCVATSFVLVLFADSNENALWFGSAVLGLSMASLFPSGIAWLESYTPVTGKTASVLIVGSSLGEMCVPLLIGYLFKDIIGPMVLMYWMLATSALSALIFVYVMWLVREHGQERESLPAEKSPALDLLHSVEEQLPMEELFKNGASSKQKSKPLVPPILKKKDHKE